jgi:hypothetical protein
MVACQLCARPFIVLESCSKVTIGMKDNFVLERFGDTFVRKFDNSLCELDDDYKYAICCFMSR